MGFFMGLRKWDFVGDGILESWDDGDGDGDLPIKNDHGEMEMDGKLWMKPPICHQSWSFLRKAVELSIVA
jgi:hypothetical protein